MGDGFRCDGSLDRPDPVIQDGNQLALSEQEAAQWFLAAPSEESFRDLFRVTAPRIVCYFRARGCDLDLAEDLTQEVMLAVYNGYRTLRNRELFRPWIYKIARNALLRYIRETGRQVDTVSLDAELVQTAGPSPDPLLLSQFAQWMAWLSPDERRIMMLRYVDQLEHHEIAAMLGIPLGTVQWKVFHSKRKLAARFGAPPA